MRRARVVVAGIAAFAVTACAGPAAPRRAVAAVAQPVTTATPATTTTAAPVPPSAPLAAPPSPLAAQLDAVRFNTDSCLIAQDNTTGQVLYAANPDTPITPASTQKLLTAAAALDVLGPEYRFTTTALSTSHPVAGAVQDLWIVGGGDPLLSTQEYAALMAASPVTAVYPMTPITSLADGLTAAGVRRVRGVVHGDDTRYDSLRYLPTWSPTINVGEFDIGPLSALELDQGLDRWRPAVRTSDPPAHAAAVLANLLVARGVGAARGVDSQPPAGAVVLASVQSAPLRQIVAAMLQASDNQIAELLARELDRDRGGRGTTAGGVRVTADEAAALGVSTAGLALVDASGLSPANRATCHTLLDALALSSRPRLSALSDGLPVAGESGTLAPLFKDTPIAGHLSAKGGYITGVTALVGRLSVGRPVRFAFVANGPFDYLHGLALTERIVDTLAAA